jgi:hypothetical protein
MSIQSKQSKKGTKQTESKTVVRRSSRDSAVRVAAQRSDPGEAFLPDPYNLKRPPARAGDDLAESLAEDFLASATSAEEIAETERDEVQPEEMGGPFTETTAREEFANGLDESNPADAVREPFPTATRSPN